MVALHENLVIKKVFTINSEVETNVLTKYHGNQLKSCLTNSLQKHKCRPQEYILWAQWMSAQGFMVNWSIVAKINSSRLLSIMYNSSVWKEKCTCASPFPSQRFVFCKASEVRNAQSGVIAIVTAEVNLINLICPINPDPGSNIKQWRQMQMESVREKYIPRANKQYYGAWQRAEMTTVRRQQWWKLAACVA